MILHAFLLCSLVMPAATRPVADAPPDGRALVEAYTVERDDLARFYPWRWSTRTLDRLEQVDRQWQDRLAAMQPPRSTEDLVDYRLLTGYVAHDLLLIGRQRGRIDANAALLPFAQAIYDMDAAAARTDPANHPQQAAALSDLATAVRAAVAKVPAAKLTTFTARRARQELGEVRSALGRWFGQYNGFDADFDWWCRKPYDDVTKGLKELDDALEKAAGPKDALAGESIGRDAILQDLKFERIGYTPEELIAMAERHMAWCEDEMKKASRELGFGDDWKKALEKVKQEGAPPGHQGSMIAAMAEDAVKFVDDRGLVTIDPECRETWRVQMLGPEEQKTWPFAAYGGQKVLVSYPTDDMDVAARTASLRANNEHFTRIVVPHELIPGHHLQGYMAERYRPYRGLFQTPFLVEGWALYWEMRLWQLGYARNAEDRIGMLFWRMHRCARIVVSLKFHIGEMTPAQMVDYLVDRVGHERDAATGEVRRYITGDYSPLYQVAYLTGGFELLALHGELVDSHRMTERAFHDAILREGPVPVEAIRAALTRTPLGADAAWRFPGPEGPVN